MNTSQHQKDIHTIIYLERLIYAHGAMVSEDDIATANLGKDTPTEAERLRVLAKYDDGNTNPHHRHWHRQSFGAGVVYLSKPAQFEPF
jgi:hypothetical protein